MPKTVPLEQRFWPKIDKSGDCWLFTGALNWQGYGKFAVGKGWVLAHRVAWELSGNPLIDGMQIDHKPTCPKNCVNPAHLRQVTNKQNGENRAGAPRNNSSGVRGVSWHKPSERWQAKVRHNGHCYYAGYFQDLTDAAEAAKQLRLKLFSHNDMDRL